MNLGDFGGTLPRSGLVLCAVSGGADSMYLLANLLVLQRNGELRVAAAHFNHRLRGAESERDETFVRDWCQANEIPFHSGSGDVRAMARQLKQGVEETARQMRYAFLRETAEAVGADVIATAHTADDNLETLLLHLVRGAGLQGLAGIRPRQGKLVRPLLSTTRRDIEEYLRLYGIPHVEDGTNRDETYSRNRMRRQVLPLLEGFNPALRENSIDALRCLRMDNDYLNAQAAQLAAQAGAVEGGVSIEAGAIARAPDALAPRVVRQLLAKLTGGHTDYGSAHLEAVVALCRREDPSGEASLPHGITARRVYGELVLASGTPPAPLVPFVPGEGETPIPGTDWALVLDGPPWPGLVVRPRQTGDEITLLGRPRRSLKKLFIDKKVPRWERERVPVLADGEGVVALAGFGPNTAHPRHGTIEARFIKSEKG